MLTKEIRFTEGKKYANDIIVPVEAVYNHPILKYDEGNRLICALPPRMKPEEVKALCYTSLPIKPSLNADAFVQESEVELLGSMCLPLEPVVELADKISTILTNSYRQRAKDLIIPDKEIFLADEKFNQSLSMNIPEGGDGQTGTAFLGIGGCGKTTLVKRVLSHYPKCIIHNIDNGHYVQIVWLKVQPVSNGDLLTFLNSIGAAIDQALMNSNGTYEKLVNSKKKLAEKVSLITKLFRVFNVGILVIDEIQRFDIKKNKLESFEIMMSIVNLTKVALMVVGTEESYHKFFFKYYLSRRLGKPIIASRYCTDYEYVQGILRLVMSSNWFKEGTKFASDVYRAMYDETAGIIERIITIWIDVQNEYLKLSDKEKEDFVLTSDFIKRCSNKNQPFMSVFAHQTLDNDMFLSQKHTECVTQNKLSDNTSMIISDPNINDDATQEIPELSLIAPDKNPEISKSLSMSSDPIKTKRLYERVKANLEESGDNYKDSYIIERIVHVLGLKTMKNKTEDEIVVRSLQVIRKHPADKISLRAMKINEKKKSTTLDISKLSPASI